MNSLELRPHIVNLVFQQLGMLLAPDRIDWGHDAQGVPFSAEVICNTFYRKDLETVRSQFMKETTGRIDRHKIIALTQKIIVDLQPLVFLGADKTPNDVFELNAEFAFLFGLQFLVKWNEANYPQQYYCEPVNHFPTEVFLYRFNKTQEGNAFWREHKKWLMARKTSPVFPLFLMSQMWFLLEQWGLEYMRHQPNTPREKQPNK